MHLQPFQFKLCCVCLCFCAGSSLPEEGMLQFLLACFVAASQAGLTGRPVWWRNQWWMEEGSAGVQSQQTAEMPSGAIALPEEGIGGGQSQQTAGMPSGANGLPAEGSFVLADPMLASVSSAGTGPPAGWHMVQEPFQDMSTIATQPVANMSEVDQNEVDFSEL